MYAVVKTENAIELKDVKIPKIDALNDVLIEVHYAGICRTDISIAKGDIDVSTPLILGHEFVGIVVDTLSEGEIKIGDIVSCQPMTFGQSHDKMCGKDCNGCFAQYIAVPRHSVVKLDKDLLSPRGAFFEPIAAALAPLKVSLPKNKAIGIAGNNRIAQLMRLVLAYYGYTTSPVDYDTDVKYDTIIETEADKIPILIYKLNKGGKLILKSRYFGGVPLPINDIVMHNISLIGTSYGDTDTAVKLLQASNFSLDEIFGEIYDLSQFNEAFHKAAIPGARKMFFRVCAAL